MMRYRRRPASLSSEAREMNRSFPAFFAGGAESLRKLVNLTITLRERFPRRECQENGPNPGGDWSRQLGAALGAEPLHYPTTPPAAGLFYFAHVLI